MTVAKLLKRALKDEKRVCFGCNNTEDLPYIQNGGVISALTRMRTKHVVPLPAARAAPCHAMPYRKNAIYANCPNFSKHLFQTFLNYSFPGRLHRMSMSARASEKLEGWRSTQENKGDRSWRLIERGRDERLFLIDRFFFAIAVNKIW